MLQRLMVKKRSEEEAALIVLDEMCDIAVELDDDPNELLAKRLEALADRYARENTAPGRPIEPGQLCDKLRGWAFMLRQRRAPEREVAKGLRDEVKRLERPS